MEINDLTAWTQRQENSTREEQQQESALTAHTPPHRAQAPAAAVPRARCWRLCILTLRQSRFELVAHLVFIEFRHVELIVPRFIQVQIADQRPDLNVLEARQLGDAGASGGLA